MSGDESGKVRVRSNVVLKDSWSLVPGELLKTYRRNLYKRLSRFSLQHQEDMYYKSCGTCGRLIAQINLAGCDQCSDAPTPKQALANRTAHEEILARVADERRQHGRSAPGNWRS